MKMRLDKLTPIITEESEMEEGGAISWLKGEVDKIKEVGEAAMSANDSLAAIVGGSKRSMELLGSGFINIGRTTGPKDILLQMTVRGDLPILLDHTDTEKAQTMGHDTVSITLYKDRSIIGGEYLAKQKADEDYWQAFAVLMKQAGILMQSWKREDKESLLPQQQKFRAINLYRANLMWMWLNILSLSNSVGVKIKGFERALVMMRQHLNDEVGEAEANRKFVSDCFRAVDIMMDTLWPSVAPTASTWNYQRMMEACKVARHLSESGPSLKLEDKAAGPAPEQDAAQAASTWNYANLRSEFCLSEQATDEDKAAGPAPEEGDVNSSPRP